MRFRKLIVVTILIVGFLLKIQNYTLYPQRGATSDEYTYSFLGVSLLTKHIPISWSYFGSYRNKQDLNINGIYFPIVWPYFDHPPLNGLVVGAWSILFGGDSFERIQLSVIRIVPIILSTLSALLVYLVAQRKFGFRVGLWALLIYSTVPIFVVQSRVVLAENLLTPLTLLAIYFYDKITRRVTVKHAIILGILAGLSFWTKEVGLVVFFSILFFMLLDRVRPLIITSFCFVSILSFLFYIAYGTYFDAGVFWKIITTQSSRVVGPQTLQYLLSTPIIINKIYLDGWYFLGFISLFSTLISVKQMRLIIVPSFAYLLMLLVLLTIGGEMGWYLIPLYPFMAIATSKLVVESLQTGNWYIFMMLLFVGFSHIQHIYEENFGLTIARFRFFVAILFGPFILALLSRKKELLAKIGSIYFYSFITGNIYLVYHYVHPA